MRKVLRFAAGLTAFAAVLAIWGGAHRYVWLRLAHDPALASPAPLVAALGLAFLAVLPFAARLLPLPKRLLGPAWTLAFGWMGYLFLLLLAVGAGDLVRLLVVPANAATANGSSLEIARIHAGIAFLVATVVAAFSFVGARRLAPVKRVEVVLDRLPKALSGFTILQISDLHVSPDTLPERTAALVERVNAEQPDLVALTGDLVDGSPRQLAEGIAPLAGLRAKHGVFFVTGNHEYYSGGDHWIAQFRSMGFRVLQNEKVSIGNGAATFDLAGVPDWKGAGFGPTHAPRLADVLRDQDPKREVVLLAHQPRQFAEAASLDIGLQLSGHTHGGQIWPFSILVGIVEPFLAGLHRHGRSQLYVSRGTGYWGPPMRLAAPHELTRITLRAPDAA